MAITSALAMMGNALARIEARLVIRAKLVPDGADQPLPPMPANVEVTPAERTDAIAVWDELMPAYAGMLNAVVGKSERANRARAKDPWVWQADVHRYRAPDGRFIGQRQMVGLRDDFINARKAVADDLASRLATKDITIQQWEVQFRREIKTTWVDEYVLGKGGRNAMTSQDWGMVGQQVRTQYQFAHDFAADIAAGNLSPEQIAARSKQYFDSATQSFERGKTASYGMPALPSYPADGTQICLSNCKCHWQIVETDTAFECAWQLEATAEHCATCVDNAGRWNPLVVPKTGRSRVDLDRMLREMGVH